MFNIKYLSILENNTIMLINEIYIIDILDILSIRSNIYYILIILDTISTISKLYYILDLLDLLSTLNKINYVLNILDILSTISSLIVVYLYYVYNYSYIIF